MAQPPRPPASIRQRPVWGLVLKAVGYVALSLGTVSGAVGYQGLRSFGHGRFGPVGTAVALALMGVLLGFGRWASRRGSQHGMPLSKPLTSIPEDEPIVLFLRSFDDDRGFAHIQSGPRGGPWAAHPSTEEQQLSNATAPFGRMTALGSPSDSLPPVGAAKDYAGDDEWRARVSAGLARARLVLLAASPGRAVRWETERVIERNLADRLVVLITGNGQRYEAFRASLSHLFPLGLPEYRHAEHSNRVADDAYVRAAVWFDADWTPHLARLHDDQDERTILIEPSRWVETAFPLAIWPVYRRADVPVPGLPSEPRGRPWVALAAVALLTPPSVILVALLVRSASHSSGGVTAIVGLLALVLVLFVYRVWWGGYISIMLARFVSLVFGGILSAVDLLFNLLFDRETARQQPWWLAPTFLSLLAAGLLLRLRSVRDWAASRVLFPPTTTRDRTPTTGRDDDGAEDAARQ